MEKLTKKQAIVQCFETLDSKRLYDLLDSSKTYMDTTKEIFIASIETAFNKFKSAKDTFLIKKLGVCNNNLCNIGCPGFTFVGNESGKHMNILFRENGETDNYSDIHQCNDFKSEYENSLQFQNISLKIFVDQQVSFKADLAYSFEKSKYLTALNQMIDKKNDIISKEFIKEWLDRFKSLSEVYFDNVILNYSFVDEFLKLHSNFSYIIENLEVLPLAKEAIQEFDLLEVTGELDLLQWVIKYEEPGLKLFPFEFFWEHDIEKPTFETLGYKMLTADQIILEEFANIFDDLYWDFLQRYKPEDRIDNEIEYINSDNNYVKKTLGEYYALSLLEKKPLPIEMVFNYKFSSQLNKMPNP
ncbi:MAG: hypothetical protein H7321_07610 [Bacteroidia bacterium]|nr:hypothetical protein [Bacteroidia bacterium]